MIADPKSTPVNCGSANGICEPPPMKTPGVMTTLEGSLLVKVTVTGACAGEGRITDTPMDLPCPTVSPASSVIVPALITLTATVVSGTFGRALAWMVVLPTATAVTGTLTLSAFGKNVTLAGTVATVASSEVRLIARPVAGAGDESFNVKFCVSKPEIVAFCDAK